jgi:hypothetical protein
MQKHFDDDEEERFRRFVPVMNGGNTHVQSARFLNCHETFQIADTTSLDSIFTYPGCN